MESKQQTSNEYGLSQQLQILSQLVNYGTVSIPYGNSARYDCILDIQGDIYKIQIKSLNISEDGKSIIVPMANSRMSATGITHKTYTSDQVDYVAIIYNHQVYLIPTGIANKTFTLTLFPKMRETQHYIEDFKIYKMLNIDLKTWNELKEETRLLAKEGLLNKYFCPDCGAPVTRKGCRCITCARTLSQKVERPSREELKKLIRVKPFTVIAKEYNVTDNAIRKWCIAYNLPKRVKDIKQYSDEEWREI